MLDAKKCTKWGTRRKNASQRLETNSTSLAFGSPAMNPFRVFQSGEPWQRVGLTSEFPELSEDTEGCAITQSCKAFRVPKTKGEEVVEASIELPGDLKDQVLVFKYKGKIHAIDHVGF
jgi:hypothetical protein